MKFITPRFMVPISVTTLILVVCSSSISTSITVSTPFNNQPLSTTQTQTSPPTVSTFNQHFSQDQGQGHDRIQLTAPPTDPEHLAYIFPLG